VIRYSAATSRDAFHTTRWTRVCVAKADTDEGRHALAELCAAYYEPVIAFLRCELRDADTAREMSHAFFSEMLAGGAIATAERERGRFRSYLLGAVKHFLSRQREAARRQKRGGGVIPESVDDEEAREVPDLRVPSPEAEFDRQWALTVLQRALDALRLESEAEDGARMFGMMQPWLTGEAAPGDQAQLAATLGMNVNSLKSHIHRLKQRFRALLKAEITSTLDRGGSVDAEMAALLGTLRGG
jgi:DNA-directed RNA polymerase specialized sigma24 family protein